MRLWHFLVILTFLRFYISCQLSTGGGFAFNQALHLHSMVSVHVERDHLCNFGRRHHEEQFCEIILNLGEIILNLDQKFRRCGLKIFFYLELW